MVFVLAFFVVLGLLLTVVPAGLLGLTAGLVSARWALPWRILLILASAGVAVAAWTVLLRHSYLLPIAVTLAAAAALFGGGLTALWSATHRRPAGPWAYRPTHLLQP